MMNDQNRSDATNPLPPTSPTNMETGQSEMTTESSTGSSESPQDTINNVSHQEVVQSPRAFERPGDFIKNLVTLRDQDVFYSLLFDSHESEVRVCDDGNARYTLCRSHDPLDHDLGLAQDQRNDRFRKLVYAHQTQSAIKNVAFLCYEDLGQFNASAGEQAFAKAVPARFVPLGCLQKSVLQGPNVYSEKHTTNYVLLWNTSTKPNSLWICYDYYTSDIHGHYSCSKLGNPTYYNESEDFVFGPQGPVFPLERNIEDDGDIPLSAIYAESHSASDRSKFSRQAPNMPPSPIADSPSKGQQHNPGYFNTSCPFDLAVLASDITQWDADSGLDPASMHDCLKHLRFRLGDSLRARAWVSRVFN